MAIKFLSIQNTALKAQDSLLVDQQTQTKNEITELEYYQKLLEQSESHNQELIGALYTIITLTVGILITIILSSIWYNYRFSKKEVQNIIDLAEKKVDELESKVLSNIKGDVSSLEKSIKEDISLLQQDMFKENLKTYKESSNN